jgi:lysozyme
MQLSPAGLDLIKRSEGFRTQVYKDINGFATIGYGHKLLPDESYPTGVTENQASSLLENDVLESSLAVSRMVHVPLTQGQFDALVDFVFNLGQGRLASSKLLLLLNQRCYGQAAAQLLLWDRAGQEVLPGLKSRREAEFALWSEKA